MNRITLATQKSTSAQPATRTLEIAFLFFSAVMFAAPFSAAQSLQRGISVELASTTGAASLPEADAPDAWIVTVTQQGDLYFGTDPVTPDGLMTAMNARPRTRGQSLYIKADARAPFASVKRVLEVARTNFFNRAFLLTAQSVGAASGPIVAPIIIAPKGLAVWITNESTTPVVIYISAGPGSPTVRVNNEQVPIQSLSHMLEQLLQNQTDKVVVLKVGQVSFADVARVVEACNIVGAKTVVGAPEL